MAGIKHKIRWEGGTLPEFMPSDMFFDDYLMVGSSRNMKVDGSPGSPILFEAGPVGKVLVAEMVSLEFLVAKPDISKTGFGGASPGTVLPNGILVETVNAGGTPIKDWNAGFPICCNADFGDFAGTGTPDSGAQNETMEAMQWRISKHGARVFINDGEKLRVTIQDNLADATWKLVFAYMRLFGIVFPPGTFSEERP